MFSQHMIPTIPARLTHALSAADLGTETSLDGGDGATRTTGVAGKEVQTVLSLAELGIGAATGLASDVLDNILDCLLAHVPHEAFEEEEVSVPFSKHSQYPSAGIGLMGN